MCSLSSCPSRLADREEVACPRRPVEWREQDQRGKGLHESARMPFRHGDRHRQLRPEPGFRLHAPPSSVASCAATPCPIPARSQHRATSACQIPAEGGPAVARRTVEITSLPATSPLLSHNRAGIPRFSSRVPRCLPYAAAPGRNGAKASPSTAGPRSTLTRQSTPNHTGTSLAPSSILRFACIFHRQEGRQAASGSADGRTHRGRAQRGRGDVPGPDRDPSPTGLAPAVADRSGRAGGRPVLRPLAEGPRTALRRLAGPAPAGHRSCRLLMMPARQGVEVHVAASSASPGQSAKPVGLMHLRTR